MKFNLIFASLMILAVSCTKDETNPRDKFLATYGVVESCPGINSSYDIIITTSAESSSTILINNFGETGSSVKATVSGNNLTIPNQTINVGGISVTLSGSGALNGNILNITYTGSAAGGSLNCSMVCTKK
ncbi:MAG: hypothetical protein IPM48_12270 [Saprospiraceae bacterium]|nr:hypothetical protein [Saprospiraceae bacterium]